MPSFISLLLLFMQDSEGPGRSGFVPGCGFDGGLELYVRGEFPASEDVVDVGEEFGLRESKDFC
jgi:hypothetical protein